MCTKSDVFKTDENTLDKVLKIFEKSRSSFDKDVANLEKWMANQPHLPEVLERKAIVNFLLMNKCNIEKTKEKIDMYYIVRSKLPDIYVEINPKLSHLKNLTNIMYVAVHPQLTNDLCRVTFMKIHNKKLAECWHPRDYVQFLINIQEIKLREDVAFKEIFICDGEGFTLNQQLKITPTLLYEGLGIIYKKVFTYRVKAVYLINMPSFGEKALKIFKAFLAPKIFDRIHICSDRSVLREYLAPEMIPVDFGGEGPPLHQLQDLMNAKLIEQQDLFDRLDKMKVDENSRPEKLNDDILGFYGDFKKLDID